MTLQNAAEADAKDEEVCGDECPRLFGGKTIVCTLPKGHAVHRSAKDGTVWERLCDEVVQHAEQAGAAIARVLELHVRVGYRQVDSCQHCSENDYPDYCVAWPCPTIRALDGTDA